MGEPKEPLSEDFEQWVTIKDEKPDLDSALTFVVQVIEANGLEFMPTISLQAAYSRQMNGELVVIYQCVITGRIDENIKKLSTLSSD